MSGQSTCSLSEALTELAFNDPTPATVVPVAVKDRRWGCSPTAARSRLTKAVHALCDAGYSGEVILWGRSVTQSPGTTPSLGRLRKLRRTECLENRRFVAGRDGLWPGCNRGDELADSFAAFAAEEEGLGVDAICVDQAGFNNLLAKHRGHGSAAKASPKGTATTTRPRLSDSVLQRWWNALSDAERDLPRDKLHEMCAAAHPAHSIARARVRNISPTRRPGPRPIRPVSAA